MLAFQQHRHSEPGESHHDHDGLGDHFHDRSGQAVWRADNIVFTTVGIDIGSSTSHFMFARLHMQRTARSLTSRFVVVDREIVWRSPILLTPYRRDNTIDARALEEFIAAGYRAAGIAPAEVDAGAVVLTGEALKRTNARAIADLFSQDAGKFVCAAAGHHLECLMGAHGSGAVRLSREQQQTVLNVDIGGGTTKFTLVRNGEIVGSSVIAVGARLLVTDADANIVRLEGPLVQVARSLGIALRPHERLAPDDRRRIVARMLELLIGMVNRHPPDALTAELLLTEPWTAASTELPLDAIAFSGGVAEYLYGREHADFGDLGRSLAEGLQRALADGRIAAHLCDPGQGIRATVSGASQFVVQASGNTIAISRPEQLPLRNVPVVVCRFALDTTIDSAAVADTVRHAIEQADIEEGTTPFALAFAWLGAPTYDRTSAVARGIAAALPRTLVAGFPLVLLIDGDVGMTLGRLLQREIAPGSDVIAIDALQLQEFDYVDIGKLIEPNDVVPVIIKSLLF